MSKIILWPSIVLVLIAAVTVACKPSDTGFVSPGPRYIGPKYPAPGIQRSLGNSGAAGQHCGCSLEMTIAPSNAVTYNGDVTLKIFKTSDLGNGEKCNWSGGAIHWDDSSNDEVFPRVRCQSGNDYCLAQWDVTVSHHYVQKGTYYPSAYMVGDFNYVGAGSCSTHCQAQQSTVVVYK